MPFVFSKAELEIKSQFILSSPVAIAVFVKTPGLSDIKTRLAKRRGKVFAEDFYKKSVECIRHLLKNVQNLIPETKPYWALAEKIEDTSDHWYDFLKIEQGSGKLGERLHCVYQSLQLKYQNVLLIGSDSPQLSIQHIQNAIQELQKNDFVVGRALDGGFYIFGGKLPIDENIWNSVPYSTPHAADKLINKLSKKNSVFELEKTFDIDEAQDLDNLKKYFTDQVELSDPQKELLLFISESHSISYKDSCGLIGN